MSYAAQCLLLIFTQNARLETLLSITAPEQSRCLPSLKLRLPLPLKELAEHFR